MPFGGQVTIGFRAFVDIINGAFAPVDQFSEALHFQLLRSFEQLELLPDDLKAGSDGASKLNAFVESPLVDPEDCIIRKVTVFSCEGGENCHSRRVDVLPMQ